MVINKALLTLTVNLPPTRRNLGGGHRAVRTPEDEVPAESTVTGVVLPTSKPMFLLEDRSYLCDTKNIMLVYLFLHIHIY